MQAARDKREPYALLWKPKKRFALFRYFRGMQHGGEHSTVLVSEDGESLYQNHHHRTARQDLNKRIGRYAMEKPEEVERYVRALGGRVDWRTGTCYMTPEAAQEFQRKHGDGVKLATLNHTANHNGRR